MLKIALSFKHIYVEKIMVEVNMAAAILVGIL
jgi:hypothetical protein